MLWTEFPIKVFADNPPEEWRDALEEAQNAWMSVIPLHSVSAREGGDILVSWVKLPKRTAGTEGDSFQVRKEDDKVVSRRKHSFIILDNSQRWSEREMRAVALHELGHALGIGGHSNGSRDVMFPEEVKFLELSKDLAPWGAPGFSGLFSPKRINTKLTPRDVNTLIRLYNCPGPVVHLE